MTDRKSKALLFPLFSVIVAFYSQVSLAIVTLKQVQVSGASQVDLLFDSKVKRDQIRVEYFNDTIQLSLNDVSVYPAKISMVSGKELSKVFAYQYAPKLVRCRLTVKGKAEDFKETTDLTFNGKVLTVRLRGGAVEKEVPAKSDLTVDEKALLEKITQAQAPPAPKSPVQPQPIVGGKNLPFTPMKVLGKLVLVLLLLCGVALLFRKKRGIFGKLGKFGKLARGSLGKGDVGPKIEMIATQYLGPKQSIAVVRVAERLLVIGITNDSINLITRLDGNGTGSEQGPNSAEDDFFSHLLDQKQHTPPNPDQRGIRSRIRNRMEGLKPL